jgi:hypothetical protein
MFGGGRRRAWHTPRVVDDVAGVDAHCVCGLCVDESR